ncbi:glycosyltransferase family 4 protein [Tortispora caseinolytica NRRL Y-17796]|uniref:Phosphatidylinositol N-acetylglucosaminyltransferase GPI3 subunit n=1 Tax=Tortispora caseinolytica NRRL Y-17796 TaxID=767744 RepID=A0A1E4TFQ7_9ASCO|nr:glycosyltransferase family 4 protein [Tortispora caseinolytica NRRL Y-17796]
MIYNIAMVSDYFYPQPGGIESHMYQLAQQLINLGHHVIIITHAYGDRTGIRYLTNGLKAYYIPAFVLYRNTTFPALWAQFPILRQILIRENIHIVHGHASLSSLCLECILHARTMGLRTVFTDHSLFGFADAGSILGNKLLKFCLSDIGHVICVSHTCKENTVLRASLDPSNVSVIPNAVLSPNFMPDPSKASKEFITIVVISRLYANKGADLLSVVIPKICQRHPMVRFIVAGSGPKEIDLEQMRERYQLQERVQLLGSVRHEDVRNLMVKGQIYLHPTLTEAFGTVLVEAASCGLLVVTTKVGGIPEVLPPHMTVYSQPSENDLVDAVSEAIEIVQENRFHINPRRKIDPYEFHRQIEKMYQWSDVAQRTLRVYNSIDTETLHEPLVNRLTRYYGCGTWAGKLFILVIIVDCLLYYILEWLYPRSQIDSAPMWPRKTTKSNSASYTND